MLFQVTLHSVLVLYVMGIEITHIHKQDMPCPFLTRIIRQTYMLPTLVDLNLHGQYLY